VEKPMIVVRAPTRISFGGGGTDLEAYYGRFGGLVLSAAITRYAYVVARRSPNQGISIVSADYRAAEQLPHGQPIEVREPLALPKAALAAFMDAPMDAGGLRACARQLILAADVPPGTGLGSSSAMAVALVRALAEQIGMPLDAAQAADLACQIEIERLGLPIGKQDQYASAFGGLNSIAFTADGVRVTPLMLSDAALDALASRLLLFATGATRSSSTILHGQRAETRDNPAVMERLHRLKALAVAMRDALAAEDFDGFGALLDHAWQEKRGLSAAISSSAIDAAYAAARAAGALGGKITGAGGGGFLLLYVPPRRRAAVRAAMAARGLRELTFAFERTGATVLRGHEERRAALDHIAHRADLRDWRELREWRNLLSAQRAAPARAAAD
jgi:D-glycero-alpha-D-manno-heptose-7-phosphate kinase